MAVGIGIAVRNAVAVLEAIVGKQSEFVRTPKYRVESGAKQSAAWVKKSYRKSAGWMPYAEVLLGLYFAAGAFSTPLKMRITPPPRSFSCSYGVISTPA